VGTVKYTTVDAAKTEGGMGSSDTNHLKLHFPNSPVGRGNVLQDNGTPESKIKVAFTKLCMYGVIPESLVDTDIPAKGTYAPNGFSADYTDNPGFPDYNNVTVVDPDDPETIGKGWPASPWVPNPNSSPGGRYTEQPAPPVGYGRGAREQYGSGPEPTTKTLRSSAMKIQNQTLGRYKLGSSSPSIGH